MSTPGQQPSTWQDYERGGHRGSVGSGGSVGVQWDELQRTDTASSSHTNQPGAHEQGSDKGLRHRRSSISMRLNSLRHAGGVNSIDNFARSWQRAAGFVEITPVRPSFRISDADYEDDQQAEEEAGDNFTHQRSLLRAALEGEGRRVSEAVADEENGPPEDTPLLAGQAEQRRRSGRGESIISIEPSLASVFGGSYGTTYGSLASRVNESSMRHAGRLFREQQMAGVAAPDKEREPILVKQVVEDGKTINVVVGQSTLPQTIFNSVNVLIGIGLLSLPLAFRYSGWIIGLLFFLFAAVTTQYTAKLLAKCLDVDSSLITFADLAFVSFGPQARVATSILFSVELVGACVALVVLFGDSLDALIPGWDTLTWKIVCGVILIPLGFLPLRLLSITSVLGILCSLGILLAVFIDGIIKSDTPGALRHPADTHLFPLHWGTVPLSFGLLMSPWGGHSVFPNIYRDMRHPHKYRRAVNVTYIFTYSLDLSMAVIGYLMFGEGVLDEVTSNIFVTRGYPPVVSIFIAICIAIIPLTKVPLNARPIVSTLEIFLGLDARAIASNSGLIGMSGWNRGLLKSAVRILTTVVFVVLAILVPDFDRIMTLLGSVACFSICIILPLAFHLKLFGKEIPLKERVLNWVLIVVSAIMAVVSTVFACLPKELIGAA